MPDLSQIFESINVGLVVLDRDLKVTYWNRWMAERSGLAPESILGTPVFTHFPSLDTPKFMRSVRAVLAFGTFAYFSQKLHKHLFPFRPVGSLAQRIPFMQQSCTMGPLRGEDNAVSGLFLIIQDVTELATYEQKLIEMNTVEAWNKLKNVGDIVEATRALIAAKG